MKIIFISYFSQMKQSITNILLSIIVIELALVICFIYSMKKELNSELKETHSSVSWISTQISEDHNTLFNYMDNIQFSLDELNERLKY